MAGYYDPNKDYSLEIKKAQTSGASQETIKQLQQERQNKIDAQYGGTDPYKGTSNIMGSTGTKTQSTGTTGTTTGTNYHQDAIDAAARGDWDAVEAALAAREGKTSATGQNYGLTSDQIRQQLYEQYGGPSQEQDIPSFEDFLGQVGYDDLSQQTQDAIKASVDAAVRGFQQQIETTNDDTAELARRAYISKMMGEKNLDQQMAANGYAGGMADTQRIAVETNYQNELNDLEMQRQLTVRELEEAITQARLSGDLQSAQELSGYLQQLQSQWLSYVQNMQSMNKQNYWNQQELTAAKAQNAYSQAVDMISQGFMPNSELLAAAGISQQEAQTRVGLVNSQLAAAATPKATSTPVYRQVVQDTPVQEEAAQEMKLGETAANLLNWYKKSGGGITSARAQDLRDAYMDGRITEAELNYILDQMGY